MRDWKTDIEKYKRGELTPAQMHALEKEALRDPFLADALEGADALDATTFSSDVNELQSFTDSCRGNHCSKWLFDCQPIDAGN
jgi:hypothetical protein